MREFLTGSSDFGDGVDLGGGSGVRGASAAGRLSPSLDAVEDVRFWKVLQIREALANGTYYVSADRLAESMLRHQQSHRCGTKTMYPA